MSLETAVAEISKLSEEVQRLHAENECLLALAKFGRWCLSEHREHIGDLDGFDVEDHAIAFGLIARHDVREPCGEGCRCDDFPGICLRETDLAKLPEPPPRMVKTRYIYAGKGTPLPFPSDEEL